MSYENFKTKFIQDSFSIYGRSVKVLDCPRWESVFHTKAKEGIHQLYSLILEYMDWDDSLMQKKRSTELVYRRNFVSWVLLQNGYSLVAISKLLNQDHTTIIYGRDRFENLFSRDPDITRVLLDLGRHIEKKCEEYERGNSEKA